MGNCPDRELFWWGVVLVYGVVLVGIILVGSCLSVGSCPSGELSWWGVVPVGSSWWGVVLVRNCPGGE